MRISLVSLGQTGAGPVYSFEMAKALSVRNDCELQVIISKDITNLDDWNSICIESNTMLCVINAYKRTKSSVILNRFNYYKLENLISLIQNFHADILYIPFGLMWARYIFWRLHKQVKIITTIHDVIFHDTPFKLSIAELGSYLLNIGSNKFVHGHIILNNKDKKHLSQSCHKPLCVIPHAGFDYYMHNKSIQSNNSIHKCIGFFGRIEHYKGLDILVEAFERCSTQNLKLIIAGNGTIPHNLKKRIVQNNSITLINRYIEDFEIEDFLSNVDLVILPYKRASQSGVIPLCFAAGKAVIATNVGALNEQVPEGTGVIVSPSHYEIADTIDYLYSHQDTIISMGKSAKSYAETHLSWNKSADLLINFCSSIIKINS